MVVAVRVEGPLGLRDQLLRPVDIGSLRRQHLRLPARHGDPVKRPVVDQLGTAAELPQELLFPGSEPADGEVEDPDDDDGEDHRDDENDDLGAGQTRHPSWSAPSSRNGRGPTF